MFFTDTNGGNNTIDVESFVAKLRAAAAAGLRSGRRPAWQITTGSRPISTTRCTAASRGGFAGLTGDAAQIRAGDNTVSRLVPLIMASRAYKDGGAIILWWDESETDGEPGDNADDFNHTIGEIVIFRPRARQTRTGCPMPARLNYSHSSDLRTMQEIFRVRATGASPYLGDAANATDLSDMFQPGVIPNQP